MHVPHALLKSFRAIISILVLFIILFTYLYYHSTLPKEKLHQVNGTIITINKRYGQFPNRDFGKYRYIVITGQPGAFEIYLEDVSDQKRVDSLIAGDKITLYIDKMIDLSYISGEQPPDDSIIRNVSFIEKDNKSYYKASDFKGEMALFMIGFCIAACLGCYILYKKEKLEY